jgi:ABC-type dipeptide/oligopeptide/nickel transport system permease subunit
MNAATTDLLSPGGTVAGPDGGTQAPDAVTMRTRSGARLFWDRFHDDKAALAALIVIGILILIAIAGGPLAAWITGHGNNAGFGDVNPHGPTTLDEFGLPKGPNSSFWFGADGEGRDLFVRTMYGTRTSLFVGVVASVIAVLLGLIVGLVAGYFRGPVDTLLSRFGDVMLAIPSLLISIGIVAACNSTKDGCVIGPHWLPWRPHIQQGLTLVICIIVLFTWSYIARLVRGYTLSLREKEFVEASRSLGASNTRIIFREILPNLAGPIIVFTTLLIPQTILYEAALSYLGLGVQSSTASWGGLLNDAQRFYDTAWFLMLFPGLMLVITTLAFNLLGDGLRDALDVRADR